MATLFAQRDSVHLGEVMVTATRTERLLASVPMPVQVIGASTIRSSGSTRLQDILGEQAGLVVVPQVNGLGNGIQIQGLNPDYTLILLDGEPLVGRYAGTLELSRITTARIKKIEIVRGPSSSLYGSEALAGVINLITEQPLSSRALLSGRYGSRNTSDLNACASLVGSKLRFDIMANRYATDGYDFSPEIFGQTVAPFQNYTLMPRLSWTPARGHEAQLSLRWFAEHQLNSYQVINGTDSIRVQGSGDITDYNIHNWYRYTGIPGLQLTARLYATSYKTKTALNKLETGDLHYADDFRQSFTRPEVQAVWRGWNKQRVTAGTGYIREAVKTTRYGDLTGRSQNTWYGFAQHEWDPLSRLTLVSGLRYDHNDTYGSQLSPKLAALFQASEKLSFKLSAGSGFKAPDFRQLYLNFDNAAASYAVFGTEVVSDQLKALDREGRILEYFRNPATMGSIMPESSFALNLGVSYRINQTLDLECNFFQNRLRGLIETIPVAVTTNQKTIYSYTNIRRALTEGLEAQAGWQVHPRIKISAGYQWLLAFDRDVLDQIKDGTVFGRDPRTLESYRLRSRDYYGLPNRSRHHATLKFFYSDPASGWDLSLRGIFRGRFGIMNTAGNVSGVLIPSSDRNANSILDRYDHFVPGYLLVNASASKKISDKWTIQLIGENLFNHTEPVSIPTLVGRTLYLHLQFSIHAK
jgi:outer membrane receptor for ferrienterochelin and colicins